MVVSLMVKLRVRFAFAAGIVFTVVNAVGIAVIGLLV